MLRSDWELVSPFAWLDTLADEEALMGGLETPFPSPGRLFPPSGRPRVGRQYGRGRGGPRDQRPGRSQGGRAGEPQTADRPHPTRKDESAKWADADFFADLPIGSWTLATTVPKALAPPAQRSKRGDCAYYTYSYNTCATVDDNGRRVSSTRRRYEDSAGRLKAAHKRQIGDRNALESTWTRADESAPRHHEEKVTSGSVDAFEDAWTRTPFGAAEERAKARGVSHQDELPDQPPVEDIAP